jgi:hypothetical protein
LVKEQTWRDILDQMDRDPARPRVAQIPGVREEPFIPGPGRREHADKHPSVSEMFNLNRDLKGAHISFMQKLDSFDNMEPDTLGPISPVLRGLLVKQQISKLKATHITRRWEADKSLVNLISNWWDAAASPFRTMSDYVLNGIPENLKIRWKHIAAALRPRSVGGAVLMMTPFAPVYHSFKTFFMVFGGMYPEQAEKYAYMICLPVIGAFINYFAMNFTFRKVTPEAREKLAIIYLRDSLDAAILTVNHPLGGPGVGVQPIDIFVPKETPGDRQANMAARHTSWMAYSSALLVLAHASDTLKHVSMAWEPMTKEFKKAAEKAARTQDIQNSFNLINALLKFDPRWTFGPLSEKSTRARIKQASRYILGRYAPDTNKDTQTTTNEAAFIMGVVGDNLRAEDIFKAANKHFQKIEKYLDDMKEWALLDIDEAYRRMGVSPAASDQEVAAAYTQRASSQVDVALDEAYERIMQERAKGLKEAFQKLGLQVDASAAEVEAAHEGLKGKNDPAIEAAYKYILAHRPQLSGVPYETLGIQRAATIQEIDAAYDKAKYVGPENLDVQKAYEQIMHSRMLADVYGKLGLSPGASEGEVQMANARLTQEYDAMLVDIARGVRVAPADLAALAAVRAEQRQAYLDIQVGVMFKKALENEPKIAAMAATAVAAGSAEQKTPMPKEFIDAVAFHATKEVVKDLLDTQPVQPDNPKKAATIQMELNEGGKPAVVVTPAGKSPKRVVFRIDLAPHLLVGMQVAPYEVEAHIDYCNYDINGPEDNFIFDYYFQVKHDTEVVTELDFYLEGDFDDFTAKLLESRSCRLPMDAIRQAHLQLGEDLRSALDTDQDSEEIDFTRVLFKRLEALVPENLIQYADITQNSNLHDVSDRLVAP